MKNKTEDMYNFCMTKLEEMQKENPEGSKCTWSIDDANQMINTYAALSLMCASQFYTITKPFLDNEDALLRLDHFLDNIKQKVFSTILKKEKIEGMH